MKNNKLEQILIFISTYTKDNGFPPSVRDIQAEFKFKSTSTVSYYLEKLEKSGAIKKSSGKNRAIFVSGKRVDMNDFSNIPLIGNITAGQPILAEQNYEEMFLMPINLFRGEDLFMLTVIGDSMINAGIYNGDKIILKRQNYADNGDIIAALIEDSATVKRYYKENNKIRLQPENSYMEPMYFENIQILGKVIGLIRNHVN